jgi:homocysteine S-methyltransferase
MAAFPHLRGWLSFTCADDGHTAAGDDIAEGARLADHCPQVVAVGVNCTAPAHIDGVIERIRTATGKPIVVYPNAGQSWDAKARGWTGQASIDDYGALAAGWHGRGARWLGGCCGITPAHIRQLRARLDGLVDDAAG